MKNSAIEAAGSRSKREIYFYNKMSIFDKMDRSFRY